jgi:ankyrin repeat protein
MLQWGVAVNAVNKELLTPLQVTLRLGHDVLARALVHGGAHVNVKDDQDITPLHIVVARGSTQITNLLLAKGARVNAIQKLGETAAYIAARLSHDGIVIALLRHGGVFEVADSGHYLASAVLFTNRYKQYIDEFNTVSMESSAQTLGKKSSDV